MLDTIRLTLSKDMFWIMDKTYFQKETQNAIRGYFKLVQNPTKSELKNGIYKPRLTMTKRFNTTGRHEATLAIEFSAPKLLYGNNFDELTENDFKLVVELLQSKLKEMGVGVFTSILENAPVSVIHYSKNIPLTDGTTPHYLISKIKEANISLALDVNQTDYRNDGHSYKWHSNSYEVAFYDKVKDLEMAKRTDKRAVENDSVIQLKLFEAFKKRKMFEVMRMEVRLNKRQKMGQLFRSLGIQSELTLKNLFSPVLAQQVLLYYLDELESKRLPMLNYQTVKSYLVDLTISNPSFKFKKKVFLCGLKHLLESMPARELRAIGNYESERGWYRMMAEAKDVSLPPSKSPFTLVRNHLMLFNPLKLVDFQSTMLNNDKHN